MPIIPEFSPTSGTNADGFADCQVNETLLTAEMATVERCNDLVIYRLDRSTGLNVIPVTAGTAFYPFGDTAAFSSGDSFVIGCPEDVQAILYNCDVAAVHNGTAPRFWTGSGSTSALVRLAVGDYIECRVSPATTVNSIVAAERHYLAMVFVSL